MPYIYETHLHTNAASKCAVSGGADYISFYKSLGFQGIFVTDHFFNGNTCIPKSLPWEERIERFCRGYEEAKREGSRLGLDVFFGWECRFFGDEFLIYGLDKEWLLKHPEMMKWDHITHYERIKADGGLVVQAHPFRERGYLTEVYVHPYQCDAFEVANAGNPHEQNRMAYRYAKENNIAMTAGSDIHKVGCTENGSIYGMCFDTPLASASDYAKRIKEGQGFSLHVPAKHLEWKAGTSNHLPVFLFDSKNIPHAACGLQDIFILPPH